MGLGKSLDLKRLARSAIAMLTAAATLALGAVMTGTAMADPAKPVLDARDAANGIAVNAGGYDTWLGSYFIDTKGGTGYCTDSGLTDAGISAYATANWVPSDSSETAARIGYILHEVDHTGVVIDNLPVQTQRQYTLDWAAAAYVVHDKIDHHPENWVAIKSTMNANRGATAQGWSGLSEFATVGQGHYVGAFTNGDIIDRAAQLWSESAGHTAGVSVTPDNSYKEAQRHGTTKDVAYKDANGNYVSTKVTVTLHGSANPKFDAAANGMYGGTVSADGKSWTGMTQPNLGATGLQLPFTAGADGDYYTTTAYDRVIYRYELANPVNGKQRMARWGTGTGDPLVKTGKAWKLQWSFQPQAVTVTDPKKLEPGDTPVDKVTSSVGDLISGTGADGTTHNTWNANTEVKAEGYYYTSEDEGILQPVKRNANETVDQYLARVNKLYGNPVATGSTVFTAAGQTNTVRAQANGRDYTVPSDLTGYYGTWVWVIRKNAQAQPDRITGDFVAEAGNKDEASLHHINMQVSSQTANATITDNGELADRITVNGLPKNLGTFKGFDALGWSADETRATVKVYWAGEKYGEASNQDDDAQYQPSTKDAPADDAHHKLIGTYTYDLADLIKADKTYRNGGTLTLNVGGENATKTVDGKTPSLKAKGTGYYIFVFSYAGCGRVSAATSAYDDVYERIFVQQHKSLGLTSHATPNRVKVGEKFHDTVTITGEYAARYLKGAYVEFNAYEPVSGEPDLTVGKLTSEKVNLTDEQIHDISVGKQVNVSSSEVTADKAGTVNWQATLFAGDGTRLATHSFGQADEAVEVTGNGKVESVSQKQGAVNGGMWDLIHVSNVTTGTNRGNVPEGSIVRVKVYKHQGEDGANEGQLVESKDFKVDTSKLRDGSNDYWFKAEMDKTYPAAGRYYWTEELIDNFGNTLDKGAYGDQDEQTDVQKYETDTAKKWLSDDNGDYSEKTVKTFDILTQTWFNDWGSDAHRDTEGDETQSHGVTNDGVKAQFSIWSQGASKADDKQVVTGKANALPNIDKKAAKAGRMYQKVKSETFTLSNLEPGTYYYGLRVTSDQDAANLKKYVGEDSDGLVYEAPKRDARESFDIVRVTSDTAEKLWTTDQSHVADTLHVQGTLPKGSAYQVEVWSVKDGKAVEKVSESAKHTLDKDVTDGDITVSDMDMPKTAGTYQFRHKVWTPDTLGGDPKVDDGSVIIDPDATTGYRYPTRELLFEGDNVASERFEVVTISTDVTRVEGGYVTSDGEHYVDVTNGAKVGDHVDIEGHMLEGYKLGFELYRRNGTADEQSDTLVRTIDPVALTDAQTTLESALVDLTDPGDYYWVTVFTKPDGSAWKPDGETEVRSAKRVKSESFHAVRITTTTAKWTSKGGTTRDVAKIEGCLPDDAIIRFDLHDYTTGNVVVEGVEKTLKELGYKGCVNGGDTVQEVTGPEVTLPDAVDHYFVEHVRFKDQDKTNDFHRGNDRVKHESTRTIDATTDTSVEYTLGSAVADHANLLNIKYSTSDGKDIRDDLTGPLTATWELYRQSAGSDTSKDVKVADVDKDGVKLESGQTEVESSPYRPTEVGLYYYVISIHDEEGNVIKRGVAREPSESFRIIKAESKTDRVVAENHDTTDAVTITGPVAEGTMVSWTLMRHGDGDASTDTVEAEYDIPEHGATLVTADQAKDALNGKTITVKPSKVFKPTKAGVNYYWVFKLSSPARDGATGEPLKPKDAQDTSHLMTNTVSAIGEVDGDDTPAQADIVDFYEDRARTESESFNVVKVTTRVSSSEATVGDRIHDTAYITGDIPNDGYCISFEYWKQNKGDVSGDHLNSTSQCVPVPAHATTVEGPEHTAIESGVHYYRERLTEKANGREVSYGEARVPGETVKVKLPPTGVMVGGAAGVLALLATAGLGFAYVGSKRRVTGRHTATGRHAA